ncbi:hypothetical protein EN794_050465 [Mesorhizobium sp. M00.F.Ca.ET.151.01.1.1]|nr:hypothetical protein EN794_050465 [Mesorhizobium sp. M00.F.Ca.ET.151.01.1.1]
MNIKMPEEHPTRIARVGSVLALLGSLIWVQWPVDFSRFNVAAAILFIAAMATWISIELADYRTGAKIVDNIMSDDVSKINSIIAMIDKNQYYILKQQAIQTYTDDDDYEGLRKVINHKGKDIFPFHNQSIQAAYEKFCESAHDFLMDFYGLYTSDGTGRSTWRPNGDGYVSEEIYQKIMTEIAKLDRRQSKLADLWEELITIARRELKGASKPIDRYEL